MTAGVATRSWDRRIPLRERDFLFCCTAMIVSFSTLWAVLHGGCKRDLAGLSASAKC